MELNKIFASHMVFAAKKPIRIYGTGAGSVTISFAGYVKHFVSDSEKWEFELPAMEYGGPYSLEAVFEDKTVARDDIYIGEVFLFSGQSNMQFRLMDTEIPKEEYVSNEKVRLFSTATVRDTDKFVPDDGWVICDKEYVGYWSALAYLSSVEVSLAKDVAIGVIACYQGASAIESWVPENTFEKIGISLLPEEKFDDHYDEIFGMWNGDGFLYNFSLCQVIPYQLSAVIWYQGESDASVAEGLVYCDELCTLIDVWRKDFGDDELPFIVVQIADTLERMTEGWKLVQRAQEEVVTRRENVKMVESRDVCETDDIHPKTKHKLAKRIAQALINI